jgi:hypothetical protein
LLTDETDFLIELLQVRTFTSSFDPLWQILPTLAALLRAGEDCLELLAIAGASEEGGREGEGGGARNAALLADFRTSGLGFEALSQPFSRKRELLTEESLAGEAETDLE